MKTFFALILSLFLNTSVALETCDYSNETDQQESPYPEEMFEYFDELIAEYDGEKQVLNYEERWLIKLSNELLQSDDVNINIIALSHLNGFFDDQVNPETDLPVLDPNLKLSVINKVLESQLATTPTLLAAMVMCEESNMEGKCDIKSFSQKLFVQDPENLNIYLSELNMAVNNADEELIEIILKQMSEAKYSKIFSPITAKLNDMVVEYLQVNLVDDFNNFESVKLLLDNGLDFNQDLVITNSILSTYYISTFLNIPSLRPLMIACEKFQKKPKNCQAIADVLIENSDTNLMTMMGYGLDVKLNEVFGDEKSLAESEAAEADFGTYIWCLAKNNLLIDTRLDILDSEFLKINTQGEHEGTNFELASLYLYDKFKDSGHDGLVDPRTCGMRYIEVQ